ncbi:MAG: TonB-dependent receptor [Ahniella sp.]|nr:TonB-dependent receptor [Ahniella sp.]
MTTQRFPRRARLSQWIALCLVSGTFAAAPGLALATPETLTDSTVTADSDEASLLNSIEVEATIKEGDEAGYVDERRATSQVIESIGAEQIARTGDSDTAQTLKRVTGLSVVDGKYVFVRGLGDRYSSVLLNGAQLPSPDPTRRVLPLDLFPTELLDGLLVQKSWSANLPGEFGGGTVQLRTRGVPLDRIGKLGFSLGFLDGTTFEDGLTYAGDGSDWTGYENARELPDALRQAIAGGVILRPQSPTNPNGFSNSQLEQFGEALAGDYNIDDRNIQPNAGFNTSFGNAWQFGERSFGVLAAVRYGNSWDNTSEIRRSFVSSDEDLAETSVLAVERTRQNIEFSSFVVAGLDWSADHRFKFTNMLLRSSEDDTNIAEGFVDDPEDISRFYELEWTENRLLANQLSGEHRFATLRDLSLNWQYTHASAGRDAPKTRRYRFDRNTATGDFGLSRRSDSNSTVYAELDDQSQDLGVELKLPLSLGDTSYLDLSAGFNVIRRERESGIRRFSFSGVGPLATDPSVLVQPGFDEVINPGTIGDNGFQLRESTRGTDQYGADQDLDGVFLAADINWNSKYRLALGVRLERNDQMVSTFSISDLSAPPMVARIATNDLLPSLAFTWFQTDQSQWRASYSETVSRPEFRELSRAPFTDPLLDLETIGNPDLKPASIQHLDVRFEHYFSETETFSAALFAKEFKNPIEKIQVPGTGSLVSFANAESASNYGLELDYARSLGTFDDRLANWYLGANYAYINSTVELGTANDIQTNSSRPLQGQSPHVGNIQLGWRREGTEATLLYNVFGPRISQVGIFGAPDIEERPFHQVDFNYRHQLSEDWSLKLKLRNLLDPKVEFQQGDEITREFRRGRELSIGLDWKF